MIGKNKIYRFIKSAQESAKLSEPYYKEKNLDYAKNFEWIFDPELNQDNRSVSYSYKVFWSDGNNTLESKNFILGKKGYIETSYIVNLNNNNINFRDEAEYAKDFVNGVTFSDGYKHADYKPGDRIAAVGVGSLVAGSLGAKVLAKTFLLNFYQSLQNFGGFISAVVALGLKDSEKIVDQERIKKLDQNLILISNFFTSLLQYYQHNYSSLCL